YSDARISETLSSRFNDSYEQHSLHSDHALHTDVVILAMRLGLYLSSFNYWSSRFYKNCFQLIEYEAVRLKQKSFSLTSNEQQYRSKDMIKIMNTLINIGYCYYKSINNEQYYKHYLDLIELYSKSDYFKVKPDRLVNVLAPMAEIGLFPKYLLQYIFNNDVLSTLKESKMKEKLYFIAESYKVFHPNITSSLLDQNYVNSLPNHIFGSWNIEKKKRKNYLAIINQLYSCVTSNTFFVKSAFVLKHFKLPDILIRLDKNMIPQLLSKRGVAFFEENEHEHTTYAIQVLSHNEICSNERHRPIGIICAKVIQLQKMGYEPVLIYPDEELPSDTANVVFDWIVQRAQQTRAMFS
ncbi:unnamed protein product, partial [Didymodactylos carnosus]